MVWFNLTVTITVRKWRSIGIKIGLSRFFLKILHNKLKLQVAQIVSKTRRYSGYTISREYSISPSWEYHLYCLGNPFRTPSWEKIPQIRMSKILSWGKGVGGGKALMKWQNLVSQLVFIYNSWHTHKGTGPCDWILRLVPAKSHGDKSHHVNWPFLL